MGNRQLKASVCNIDVGDALKDGVIPIESKLPIYMSHETPDTTTEEEIYCLRYQVSSKLTSIIKKGMEELQHYLRVVYPQTFNDIGNDVVRLGIFRTILIGDDLHFFKCNLERTNTHSGLPTERTLTNEQFNYLSTLPFFKNLIIASLQKQLIDILLRKKEDIKDIDEVFSVDTYFSRSKGAYGFHYDIPINGNYLVKYFSLLYLLEKGVVIKSATVKDKDKFWSKSATFAVEDESCVTINNDLLVHSTPKKNIKDFSQCLREYYCKDTNNGEHTEVASALAHREYKDKIEELEETSKDAERQFLRVWTIAALTNKPKRLYFILQPCWNVLIHGGVGITQKTDISSDIHQLLTSKTLSVDTLQSLAKSSIEPHTLDYTGLEMFGNKTIERKKHIQSFLEKQTAAIEPHIFSPVNNILTFFKNNIGLINDTIRVLSNTTIPEDDPSKIYHNEMFLLLYYYTELLSYAIESCLLVDSFEKFAMTNDDIFTNQGKQDFRNKVIENYIRMIQSFNTALMDKLLGMINHYRDAVIMSNSLLASLNQELIIPTGINIDELRDNVIKNATVVSGLAKNVTDGFNEIAKMTETFRNHSVSLKQELKTNFPHARIDIQEDANPRTARTGRTPILSKHHEKFGKLDHLFTLKSSDPRCMFIYESAKVTKLCSLKLSDRRQKADFEIFLTEVRKLYPGFSMGGGKQTNAKNTKKDELPLTPSTIQDICKDPDLPVMVFLKKNTIRKIKKFITRKENQNKKIIKRVITCVKKRKNNVKTCVKKIIKRTTQRQHKQ